MIRHYLIFETSGHGRREIIEPTGFDAIDFVIEKEDDRIAIDSPLAAGKNRLTIYEYAEPCFEIIMYNIRKYGYEAVIKYEINFDGEEVIIGEVDLATRETDKVTYIEFAVREENFKQILKRNEELNTNLLSNTDLKGNPITPCTTHNVLLKAKPTVQISRWNAPAPVTVQGSISLSATGVTTNTGTNPSYSNIEGGIEDSLSFISTNTVLTEGVPNLSTFTYLRARENIRGLQIDLTNLNLKVQSLKSENVSSPNIESASGFSRLIIRWGLALETSSFHTLHSVFFSNSDSPEITFPTSFSYIIPTLNRNESVWIYLENKATVVFSDNVPGSSYIITNNFASMDVRMECTSIAYSTVVPMIRLKDVLSYVVKSSSGLNVNTPRWNEGGEFYDQYVTSTPLLRNLIDKPFYVSFKDITDKYFPEVYGDFQIQHDGTVFMGRYPDFYRNEEIGYFPQQTFDEYTNTINPRYCINQLFLKFSNYASQKEIEEDNTNDIVHGESQNKLDLESVQNKKEISIGFIRDPNYIEQARRKAYNLNDTSATQDDDKKYLNDVTDLQESDRYFTETSLLRHNANGTQLYINNDGSFSWLLLGIVPGTIFVILTGPNAGTYTVNEIDERQIFLILGIPGPTPVDIDEENTTYRYYVSPLVTNLVNRTSEGFASIENIANGTNYGNLRFTSARIIRNYYNEYLASCNLYAKNPQTGQKKPIKNILYRNNGMASTRLIGEALPVIENEEFLPTNAILEPEIDSPALIMSLRRYIKLLEDVRLKNGFIKYIDSKGLIKKGYILKGSYEILNRGANNIDDFEGILKTTVELKYEQFDLTIFGDGSGVLIINNTNVGVNIRFEIDEFENLIIFDETGKKMYPPVPYYKVKVNNSDSAINPVQLIQWLNAIT